MEREGGRVKQGEGSLLLSQLTKLLGKIEEWFWFAGLTVRRSPEGDVDLDGLLYGQVEVRRGGEHNGELGEGKHTDKQLNLIAGCFIRSA